MKDNKDDKLDNKKRKIEFRAKATNRDGNRTYRTNYKNGDWVYGLITDMENYYGYAQMVNSDGVSGIDVDPDTVGQFTGLCDKNGKKIYEGDVVEFDEKEWGCKYYEEVKWDYELLDLRKNDYKQWCVVVGNVYDNPELLGGSDEECDN